jgi:Tol biopolymer transport system component
MLIPAAAEAVAPTSGNGRIAFSQCEPSPYGRPVPCYVWSMNPDGSGIVNLSKSAPPFAIAASGPQYSPDGRLIAFASADIWLMNADGSGFISLTNDPNVLNRSRPTFTPDQRFVLFDSGVDIWKMRLDGSHQVNLTWRSPGFEGSPSVAPDGRTVVYDRCAQPGDCDIWAMNVDGSAQRQLVPLGDGPHNPSFSPDGRSIAFQKSSPDGSSDLYVMAADGSRQINLTNTPAPLWETSPSFSPDGQWIVFSRWDDGQRSASLALIRRNGADLTLLEGAGEADWQPLQHCGKRRATIVGDDGPDKIKGTKRSDVIVANAGKDKIFGRGGNDLICLGKGKDKAVGGKGRDKCIGGPGRDHEASCERGKL